MEVKQSTAIESANAIAAAETAAAEAAKAAEVTTTTTVEPIITPAPTVVAPVETAPVIAAPVTTAAPQENEVIEFDIPEEAAEVTETTTAPSTTISWKEAIKDVPEDDLAEMLGDDDFMKGMRKHIKNGGSPTDYIYAKGINWEKVDDAALLKGELKNEFPDATEAQLQRLFNKKYNQTDLAEDEDKEDGLLLMKSDARKVRANKIAEQQRYKIPDARVITAPPQIQQSETDTRAKEQYQKDLGYIQNHNTYKQLFESKRVAIELADGAKLNLGIKTPQALMDVWFKQGKLFSLTRTPQGEPDVQLMQEAALYFSNPAQFKKSIYNAGKEAGVRSLVEEGQNAGKQGTVLPLNANAKSFDEAIQGGVKQGTIGKFASNQ